jgi:hypothetical protein
MKFQPEQWRQLPAVALRESLRLMDRPFVPAHCVPNDGTRPFPTVAADCQTCSGTGTSPFRADTERLPCLACGGTGREDEVEEFVAVAPKSLALPLIVVGTLISLSLAFLLVSANLKSNRMQDSGTSANAVNISAEARRQVHERLMAGRTQVEFPSAQDDRDRWTVEDLTLAP